MKTLFHISLIVALALSASTKVIAQPCIPTSDTTPGFSPDTLATAFVGIPYEEVIQFHLPPDTTVVLFGDTLLLYLDSLHIDSVVGLPEQFSFVCNDPNCIIYGGQSGCAVLSGTADTGDVGIHPLLVYLTIFLSDTGGAPLFLNQGYDFYFLDVELATGLSFSSPANLFQISDPYPNPASNVSIFSYSTSYSSDVSVTVMNMYGREISFTKFKSKPGVNFQMFDVSKLMPGEYFVIVKQGDMIRSAKLVVER